MADRNTKGGHSVAKANGAATRLQERLSEPETVDNLLRILDKLELVAFTLNAADGFLHRAEELGDNLSDTIEEARQTTDLPNVDIKQALGLLPDLVRMGTIAQGVMANDEVVDLLRMLQDKEKVQALKSLLENAELIAFGLEAMKGFVARGEVLAENVAESLQEVRKAASEFQDVGEHLPEIVKSIPEFADTALRMKRVTESREVKALWDSGVFAPHTVRVVGKAGNAAAQSFEETVEEEKTVGLFQLLGALNDPDVKQTVSFAYHFAKDFGAQLNRAKRRARAVDRP